MPKLSSYLLIGLISTKYVRRYFTRNWHIWQLLQYSFTRCNCPGKKKLVAIWSFVRHTAWCPEEGDELFLELFLHAPLVGKVVPLSYHWPCCDDVVIHPESICLLPLRTMSKYFDNAESPCCSVINVIVGPIGWGEISMRLSIGGSSPTLPVTTVVVTSLCSMSSFYISSFWSIIPPVDVGCFNLVFDYCSSSKTLIVS